MKTILFLNGSEGYQTGIEDGFLHLKESDKIDDLIWFYYQDHAKKHDHFSTHKSMIELAKGFQPQLIVFFHIGNFPVDKKFIYSFKNLASKPIIVYDEGDMYGGWSKPITNSMKIILKIADIVSIRGLGKFYNTIQKLNKNIIYTPHHNDIARYDKQPFILSKREYDLVLIGNRIKSKYFEFIRSLHGAAERESFVKTIASYFPSQFKLFGNGWKNFQGNQGPVDFFKQNEIYKTTWITVAYEHYPEIPYYFSNRLPIALMSGSLYVCHYHEGYDKMFPNCDFIFFFKSNREAIDIINYILSLSKEELLIRSNNARNFAIRQYHPNVIWMNFFNNVMKYVQY